MRTIKATTPTFLFTQAISLDLYSKRSSNKLDFPNNNSTLSAAAREPLDLPRNLFEIAFCDLKLPHPQRQETRARPGRPAAPPATRHSAAILTQRHTPSPPTFRFTRPRVLPLQNNPPAVPTPALHSALQRFPPHRPLTFPATPDPPGAQRWEQPTRLRPASLTTRDRTFFFLAPDAGHLGRSLPQSAQLWVVN